MTESLPFSDTVRSFMDTFMDRSMRGWKRYAREAGLSWAQINILMQLHHHGACSISDVGGRFEITSAAASQLAEKLVQAGLLERTEDPTDRRSRLLTLSPKGREFVEQGFRERYRWVDELGGRLSPQEQQKVIEALALMTEAAQRLEPVS